MATEQGESSTLPLYLDPLDHFPNEISDMVAANLSAEKIELMKRVSRRWHEFLTLDRSPAWKTVFGQIFDVPQKARMSVLKQTFQERMGFLRDQPGLYGLGTRRIERDFLDVIRDIIIDANAGLQPGESSNNIKAVRRVFSRTDKNICEFLNMGWAEEKLRKRVNPTPIYYTVQVMLTPLHLNRDMRQKLFEYNSSLYQIFESRKRGMIFKNIRKASNQLSNPYYIIDMELIGDILNFFKFNLLKIHTCEVASHFARLPSEARPSFWTECINDCEPGNVEGNWLLSQGQVTERMWMRYREDPNRISIIPEFWEVNSGYQTFMSVSVSHPTSQPTEQPIVTVINEFDGRLVGTTHPLVTQPAPTRIGDRPIEPEVFKDPKPRYFEAKHHESTTLGVTKQWGGIGWISPIHRQCGIPGWQRFSMVRFKYLWDVDPSERPLEDPNSIDTSRKFVAFEGVVLPGGKIIFGYWWIQGHGQYNCEQARDVAPWNMGPFMMWKDTSSNP